MSETKQQSTAWVFEDKPNPTTVGRGGSTSKRMVWSPVSSAKLVMWRLYHLSIVGLRFIRTHQERNTWSTIFHQKILLECSKTMFSRCLKRSGKTNINYGRTSKHSEYPYAKKCQTFLRKCQICPGNTRNMLGLIFIYLTMYIF